MRVRRNERDALQLGFRSIFAFFIVDLGSPRVVHGGVTRHPTAAWVAQQLREATPFGAAPCFLIRDNDATFGPQFACVARGAASRCCGHPSRRHARTPSASASSAVCGATASTIF